MSEGDPRSFAVAGTARLQSCPACGYLLSGLPDRGTCPECGGAYEPTDTITLFGRTRGLRAFAPDGNWSALVMLPAAFVFLVYHLPNLSTGDWFPYLWLASLLVMLGEQAFIAAGARSVVTVGPAGSRQ